MIFSTIMMSLMSVAYKILLMTVISRGVHDELEDCDFRDVHDPKKTQVPTADYFGKPFTPEGTVQRDF
jgi:hypothetical protein